MRRLLGSVFCATLALTTTGTVWAQVGHTPSFEVASVRLTAPKTAPTERVTGSRVDLTNISLRQLLWMAFRIDPFHSADRLSAPGWVATVSVDVHATIPTGGSREQVPDMVKGLLVERFGLRTHVEPRATDVYELVVGEGGIRIHEVEAVNDLDRVFPTAPARKNAPIDDSAETLRGRVRTAITPLGIRTITERSMYELTFTARRTVQVDAARISMDELASVLAMNIGRPVLDKTGLIGLYRLEIELPPYAFVLRGNPSFGMTLDPTGVSVFHAVEQLGLKLEPRRIPMDSIVVDRIERIPTEN